MAAPGHAVHHASQATPHTGSMLDCAHTVYAFGVLLYEMVTGRHAFESHPQSERRVVDVWCRCALPQLQRCVPHELLGCVPHQLQCVKVCCSSVGCGDCSNSTTV